MNVSEGVRRIVLTIRMITNGIFYLLLVVGVVAWIKQANMEGFGIFILCFVGGIVVLLIGRPIAWIIEGFGQKNEDSPPG